MPPTSERQRPQDVPPFVRLAAAAILVVLIVGFVLDLFLLPFMGSQRMRATETHITTRYAQAMWERDACVNNAARLLEQPTGKIEPTLFTYIGTPSQRQRMTPNEVVIQLRAATGVTINEQLISKTLRVILDCRDEFTKLVTSTNKLVDRIQHPSWFMNRYGGKTDQRLRITPPAGRPLTGSDALWYLGRSDWTLRRTSQSDFKTS